VLHGVCYVLDKRISAFGNVVNITGTYIQGFGNQISAKLIKKLAQNV
jgi:hypothetical protein